MNDIDSTLKEAYNATSTIVMPGSGSYGMEAVARQWATGKNRQPRASALPGSLPG